MNFADSLTITSGSAAAKRAAQLPSPTMLNTPRVSFEGESAYRRAFEWSGAAVGVTGSTLIAGGYVGPGFCLFLVSNVLLSGYAIRAKAWGILAMQCVYTGTSVLGIWKWMF